MARTVLNQRSVTVATYPTYEGAMDALAYLRGHEFPTQYAEIIAEKVKEVKDRPAALLATLQLLRGGILGALTGSALTFILVYFNYITSTMPLLSLVLYGAGFGAAIGLVLEMLSALLFGVARQQSPHYTAEVFDVTVHEQYMDHALRLLNSNEVGYGTEVEEDRSLNTELPIRSGT